MSFAIGAASDTPAVRTFCVFSAVAIAICYLYQLILLPAVVALSGHREKKGYQSVRVLVRYALYFIRTKDTYYNTCLARKMAVTNLFAS